MPTSVSLLHTKNPAYLSENLGESNIHISETTPERARDENAARRILALCALDRNCVWFEVMYGLTARFAGAGAGKVLDPLCTVGNVVPPGPKGPVAVAGRTVWYLVAEEPSPAKVFRRRGILCWVSHEESLIRGAYSAG